MGETGLVYETILAVHSRRPQMHLANQNRTLHGKQYKSFLSANSEIKNPQLPHAVELLNS